MSKPVLAKAFRSNLEERVADQMKEAGVEYGYETEKLAYSIPARTANYLPDFPIPGTNIYIEAKGAWGAGRFGGMKSISAEQRQKMLLVKEQHPGLDIRIVYERATTKIYPGSPTTNAKWAEDHGFKWADRGVIPAEWIEEIRALQKKTRGA